ncbi:hypothetical protein Nepgr_017390 [Nepenthes gracilis]|uniref:Uncharacterized protein n=1 Tax=Nepenthes gracilis TaxID=150966 RepID=A0AAD3SRJ4_NEPGR|nr:hypothetical protein Nepgr_017390 [Nepenthes gracilis]
MELQSQDHSSRATAHQHHQSTAGQTSKDSYTAPYKPQSGIPNANTFSTCISVSITIGNTVTAAEKGFTAPPTSESALYCKFRTNLHSTIYSTIKTIRSQFPASTINKTQLVHQLLSSNNSICIPSAQGNPAFYLIGGIQHQPMQQHTIATVSQAALVFESISQKMEHQKKSPPQNTGLYKVFMAPSTSIVAILQQIQYQFAANQKLHQHQAQQAPPSLFISCYPPTSVKIGAPSAQAAYLNRVYSPMASSSIQQSS